MPGCRPTQLGHRRRFWSVSIETARRHSRSLTHRQDLTPRGPKIRRQRSAVSRPQGHTFLLFDFVFILLRKLVIELPTSLLRVCRRRGVFLLFLLFLLFLFLGPNVLGLAFVLGFVSLPFLLLTLLRDRLLEQLRRVDSEVASRRALEAFHQIHLRAKHERQVTSSVAPSGLSSGKLD